MPFSFFLSVSRSSFSCDLFNIPGGHKQHIAMPDATQELVLRGELKQHQTNNYLPVFNTSLLSCCNHRKIIINKSNQIKSNQNNTTRLKSQIKTRRIINYIHSGGEGRGGGTVLFQFFIFSIFYNLSHLIT